MNTLPQVQNNSFCGDFAPPEQLRGYTAKWDKEKNWHDGSDGLPLPSPLLVIGTDTLLVRWHPQVKKFVTSRYPVRPCSTVRFRVRNGAKG
jgi:hypothetical protein